MSRSNTETFVVLFLIALVGISTGRLFHNFWAGLLATAITSWTAYLLWEKSR